MKWSEEQAAAAERKVQENSSPLVCPEKQGALRCARSVGRASSRRQEKWGHRDRFITGLMENSGPERVGEGTG